MIMTPFYSDCMLPLMCSIVCFFPFNFFIFRFLSRYIRKEELSEEPRIEKKGWEIKEKKDPTCASHLARPLPESASLP
jgi:hypothetical protein